MAQQDHDHRRDQDLLEARKIHRRADQNLPISPTALLDRFHGSDDEPFRVDSIDPRRHYVVANGDGRLTAALRANDADVIVFVCHDGERQHYFVMPFDRVRGLTHIEIRNADPAAYAGWMAAWRDAWHLIDQLIASGLNHWQPALL